MALVNEFRGKGYRILTPSVFRRIVSRYDNEYDVRIISGNSYLVDTGKNNFLVDIIGYSRNGGCPIIIESLEPSCIKESSLSYDNNNS